MVGDFDFFHQCLLSRLSLEKKMWSYFDTKEK